jgi:hypothetical protein
MKIIFFASVILFVQITFAQNNDTITNIEKKCRLIDTYNTYKTDTLKNEAFLDQTFLKQKGEGFGQLVAYYKNDTLVKISEYIGIRAMKDFATTVYYFYNNQLIFISETERLGPEFLTDSSGTTDHKVKQPDFDGRYYFNKGKLIYSKIKGQMQILPNEEYFYSQSKEGQLLTSAEKNRSLFLKKKK